MRIRSIKPEFWKSTVIAGLKRDVRLCFIGLWNYVDDYGRGVDDPRLVKAELFPMDDDVKASTVTTWLDTLVATRLITRYEVSGRKYLRANGFDEHQRVSHPTSSRIPPEPSGKLPEDSVSPPENFSPRVRAEGKGREGSKGREQGKGELPAAPGESASNDEASETEFTPLWSAYPKRPGNSRRDALKVFLARRKEGVAVEAMQTGVEAFAAHHRRKGTPGEFIMHASRFLGPGRHWESDWGAEAEGEDFRGMPPAVLACYNPDTKTFRMYDNFPDGTFEPSAAMLWMGNRDREGRRVPA